ncbi:MAG: glycosyltransferase family 2 protein [Bacteroidales bacterium]|nr:glycosyltransferase family 2 protein [Bacteroidales bacterium]
MNTLVSVLIPVYNTERMVAACLESIIGQTYKNLEIIIVNDCTQDNAMDIVKSFADIDPRIKIINHDRNLGLMMTRKTGYQNASGEYIVFVDSDDTLPKNSIEKRLNFIKDHNCDFATTGTSFIWQSENRTRHCLPEKEGVFSRHEIYEMLINETLTHSLCTAIFPSKIFKGQQYKTLPGHIMGEDILLFYQILDRCNKIGVMRTSVYNYIQRDNSSTNAKITEKTLRELVICWNTQYYYLHKNNFSDTCIFRRILPEIVYLYYNQSTPEIYNDLSAEIKKGFKLRYLFKCLSPKQALTFIILDKTVVMSRLLRWLFAKFR